MGDLTESDYGDQVPFPSQAELGIFSDKERSFLRYPQTKNPVCPQAYNLTKGKPETGQNADVEVRPEPVRCSKRLLPVKNPREEMRDACLMKRKAAF